MTTMIDVPGAGSDVRVEVNPGDGTIRIWKGNNWSQYQVEELLPMG